MTYEWFFAVMVLAVLLSRDWIGEGRDERAECRCDPPKLGRLCLEAAEMGAQILLLMGLYYFALVPQFADSEPPFFILIYLPGVYIFQALKKSGEIFPLVVFGCCVWLSTVMRAFDLRDLLLHVGLLMAGLTGVRVCLLGVCDRLRFTALPFSVRGFPVFFMAAALVALALWGFQGVIPVLD